MTDLVPRRFQPLVIAALLAAVVVLALGNFDVEEGEEGGTAGFVIALVISIAVGVLLWRFLVQPALDARRPAARDGLIAGIVAVLFALLYWTGLPFVVAPVAIALGTLGRERAGAGARRTRAAADGGGAEPPRTAASTPEGAPAAEPAATFGPDPAAEVIPSDPKTGTAAVALGWVALIGATVIGLIDGLG